MFNRVQEADEWLLYQIHIRLGGDVQDALLPFFRNPYFWSPVYLFLLVYMWQQFGRRGIWWCICFLACFALTDYISAGLLKPVFHRIRPCANEELGFSFRALIPCGRGFSMPSSHAANHVSFAAFMYLSGLGRSLWSRLLIFLWPLLVVYAQLYVGAHYPSDILVGALLGIGTGSAMAWYYRNRFGNLIQDSVA
ncbi:MAG TPA: phosphatase PAP2 family protein [Chitinophagaceae bacterium]|nr:phosphatase PAP2 family protein [Chitinophagaceae bacterium]